MPDPRSIAIRWLVAARDDYRQRRLRLFHGTRSADAILAGGFDIHKVRPQWLNDFAVSTLTTEAAVRRYMGNGPGLQVVAMDFRGTVATPDEANAVAGWVSSPQQYRQELLAAGIDAVMLNGTGARQVYVYNLAALSNLRLAD